MRIAINGFGRIGRTFLRTVMERNNRPIEVVAINDLTDTTTLAHLFQYDSVHGQFKGTVHASTTSLSINEAEIQVYTEKNPEKLPWRDLDIHLVLEATGQFVLYEQAMMHIQAGAKQVLISAPSFHPNIPIVILGVNDTSTNLQAPILSNASCTTNNVAPMLHVIDTHWGIQDAYVTTVHSMTQDQRLHDAPHKDLRRARSAAASIIPTSTGAAKAIVFIFPHLSGKLGGAGIRVPVLNGSLSDVTCTLKNPTSIATINEAFYKAAHGRLKNILQYTEDPIVSVDILGNPHSCIFDAQLTSVVGKLVKVVGWYDNETGYANRLADLLEKIQDMSK